MEPALYTLVYVVAITVPSWLSVDQHDSIYCVVDMAMLSLENQVFCRSPWQCLF